ncbi:MAG: DUF2892 domain-containing protein [Gemmatimonadetes bacterium]|nr:DUF2892 domain-containing protein [Gemmatimonadota bacterium]MBI2403051.1 DUF2892 domain-containing protein [Gemmatimonadota bacterium]MBI2537247.1 DUF2892 domain-containing protein [Gemmatimonadota bacterium]MBI2616463.1 DUF2892 domain-containing protein [Gemmatimonadota bacterium]
MNANVGVTDARIRWALALVCFAVAIGFNASPLIALLGALVALVLAGTALTHVCPIWRFFHIDTSRRHIPAQRG